MAALALAGMTTACYEEGEGILRTRIYGEELVEQGIPADVFVDGWEVSFTRFLVVVDDIAAHDVKAGGRYAFDLTDASSGEGQEIVSLTVPEGEQALDYRIAPGEMAMGYSLFVEGAATKHDATIDFAWGFDTTTEYSECEVADFVAKNGEATTVITIHADHIFYDDLDSPEPNVAFDLIAASDADMDGTVTKAELLARDITTEARYQVGSRDVTNLWDFMSVQTTTVGHIDGEGHCEF
jgi:hypothetical protein